MRSRLAILVVTLALVSPLPAGDHDDRVQVSDGSDDRAIEIAQSVMAAMGGWEAWDQTRFLSWKFFGRRQHYWDRWTGDVRITAEKDEVAYLWLMNVNREEGRVWKNGEEVTDPAELTEMLEMGRKIWVNDSYWVIMPYKLLDPGVTLTYSGKQKLKDRRVADVLELTFSDGVGYTPENRYEVFVARDTGLVEQWSFYGNATDEEAGFTLPWAKWESFGGVMLATDHGQKKDWDIAVHDELPASLFTDPAAASP